MVLHVMAEYWTISFRRVMYSSGSKANGDKFRGCCFTLESGGRTGVYMGGWRRMASVHDGNNSLTVIYTVACCTVYRQCSG